MLVIFSSMELPSGIHGTTSDPRPAMTFHLVLVHCHEPSRLACPCAHVQQGPDLCRQQQMRQVVRLPLCDTAINCSFIL